MGVKEGFGNVEGERSEVDVAFLGGEGRNLRDGEVKEGCETRCQGDHTGSWAFSLSSAPSMNSSATFYALFLSVSLGLE
jgi:hypothetical protein